MPRQAEEVLLTATTLDLDGRGVGVVDAIELAVPGLLPGERARVVVEHVSPHAPRAWGRLVALDGAPSPDRATPACPAFGRCGGCALQHLTPEAARAAKHARVVAALAATPGALPPGVDVAPTRPSPAELGYRNKSKLVIGGAAGALVFGAFAPASHDLVDTRGCRVPEAPLDALADDVRAALDATGLAPWDDRARVGALQHVVLRHTHAGALLVVIVARPGTPRAPLAAAAAALATRWPALVGVVLHTSRAQGGAIFDPDGIDDVLHGVATVEDRVGDVTLALSARSFFQINRAQAGRLYARVAALAAGARGAVDLYGGVGGIALTLARAGIDVVGVETLGDATADAARSAAAQALTERATFITADAASGLVDAAARLAALDVVVVNPPRKGLAPAATAAVLAARPRRVIYVSCGPESLARDLAMLAQGGYDLGGVEPYDLLPGTPHVETLAWLDRRSLR